MAPSGAKACKGRQHRGRPSLTFGAAGGHGDPVASHNQVEGAGETGVVVVWRRRQVAFDPCARVWTDRGTLSHMSTLRRTCGPARPRKDKPTFLEALHHRIWDLRLDRQSLDDAEAVGVARLCRKRKGLCA